MPPSPDTAFELGDDTAATVAAATNAAAFPMSDPIKEAFWQWYDARKEDVILKKRFLFFNVQVKVKQLKFLFEMFFGPHVDTVAHA